MEHNTYDPNLSEGASKSDSSQAESIRSDLHLANDLQLKNSKSTTYAIPWANKIQWGLDASNDIPVYKAANILDPYMEYSISAISRVTHDPNSIPKFWSSWGSNRCKMGRNDPPSIESRNPRCLIPLICATPDLWALWVPDEHLSIYRKGLR